MAFLDLKTKQKKLTWKNAIRENNKFHFHQIGPLGRFDLVVAMSVCVFDVPFQVLYFEAYFAPTFRSAMSKIFRDSESLGKSAGKTWSQN